MSVIIGENKIKAIYVGAQKIVKAYVGEKLVFSTKKSPRLPDGYTELEYVQLGPNNTTLANFSLASARTDQVVTIDLTVVAPPTSDSSMYAYRPCILYSEAVVNQTALTRDVLFLSKDGSLKINSSAGSALERYNITLFSGETLPKRAVVVWDGPNQGAYIDDGALMKFASFGVGSKWLLGSSYADGWKVGCARVHSIKIQSAGSTSASYNKDLVPAKNAAGKVGFYDLRNSKFIYNASLIAGPAV